MAVAGYETRKKLTSSGTWDAEVDAGLALTDQYTGLTAETSYDFQVRAYDAAGNFSAWSATVSETTEATPFSPADVAGLHQWLKADAITGLSDNDPVATWADSSGNANDATGAGATRPTYQTAELNSLPIVRFDGSDDELALGNLSALTAGEIFLVIKIGTDPPGAGAQTGLWRMGSSANADHYPFTDGVVYNGFGSTARHTVGNPTPALTSWRIVNIWSAANDWSFQLDGATLFSTATNTVGFSTAALLGHGIFAGTHYYLDGDVAEYILYDNKVSSGNRTSLLTHLQSKYGI